MVDFVLDFSSVFVSFLHVLFFCYLQVYFLMEDLLQS